MRKILLSVFAVASLMACNKFETSSDEGSFNVSGNLLVSVVSDDITKASGTTVQGNEATVTDAQVFILDLSGNVVAYRKVSSIGSAIGFNIQPGSYNVRAVVNGPDLSAVKTASALDATSLGGATGVTGLSSYNATSSDFIMSGAAASSVTVTGTSAASATVNVSRYVARVCLTKVTNKLPSSYGTLTLDNVYLTNVVTNQTIAGSDAQATANTANKYGRVNGSIITSSTAEAADLTYRAVNGSINNGGAYSSPKYMYCYANSTTADAKAYSATYTANATRLVVEASFNGKKYYYPVVINTPKRNYTYDVEMSISGKGLDDPQGDIEDLKKGALNCSIVVNSWTGGDSYSEEY